MKLILVCAFAFNALALADKCSSSNAKSNTAANAAASGANTSEARASDAANTGNGNRETAMQNNSLDREVEITVQKPVVIDHDGVQIRLQMLDVEDSRCPENARCIQAGEARVRFSFCAVKRGATCQPTAFDLRLTSNDAVKNAEKIIGDYKIGLLGLLPYPQANQPVDKSKYVATVHLTR